MSKQDDIAMNPGSDTAMKKGCTCPVLDNARGYGIGGGAFWISSGCPLHSEQLLPPDGCTGEEV